MKKIHVVPTPSAEGKSAAEAVEQLRFAIERTLQEQASANLRYVGQVDAISWELPGCWDEFMGKKKTAVPVKFLVFEGDA